jgi:hypothetical protein
MAITCNASPADNTPIRLDAKSSRADDARTSRDAQFSERLYGLGKQLGDGILISSRRRGSEHNITLWHRPSNAEVKLAVAAGTDWCIVERRVTQAAGDLILLSAESSARTMRPKRQPRTFGRQR